MAHGHHRFAIGCAGIRVLDNQVGGQDIYGRTLQATLINRADAIASAATIVMGETTEKTAGGYCARAELSSNHGRVRTPPSSTDHWTKTSFANEQNSCTNRRCRRR